MRNPHTACGRMALWKWILLILFGFLVFTVSYAISTLAGTIEGTSLFKNLVQMLAGCVLLGIYACWVRLFEHRWPSELRFSRMLPDASMGIGIGIALFCVVTAILAITGHYSVNGISPDWPAVATAFTYFFVIAAGEELIFRGIIFRMIDERFSTWAALLVSALIFGFVHLGNDGATVWSSIAIAIEAGLLLGISYKYSNTLWMPIGIHWTWNFTQGNVFGFMVSGTDAGDSIIQATVSGPDIITGGAFGPEASIFAATLGLALSFVFAFSIRNKHA